jgi:hypothetical protein
MTMPVSRDDFQHAMGYFLSLEPLGTDAQGWITAIAVDVEGIVGCQDRGRRGLRTSYRLLASVNKLADELPTMWVAHPDDSHIEHVNIFHATALCPFTGTKLPTICWGITPKTWVSQPASERRLANLLEAARQVLANTNTQSRAR